MTIDLTKPLQTIGGREARLLASDLKDGAYTLAVAVTKTDGTGESLECYRADGKYYSDGRDSPDNLENVPEEKVTYFNVVFDGLGSDGRPDLRVGFARDSIEAAKAAGILTRRLSVLKVTEKAGNRTIEVAHTY